MSAWLDLVRVHDRMHKHLMDHLENYDLTIAQYDVLAHLSEKPGITQQALAQELLVTKGNICGLIDRMSAHGLVERRSDPEDRRSNLLHLTSEGERLAREAVPAYDEFVRQHMSGITPRQLAELREILAVLDNSLHDH
ncbi:MAG TPA: MarR family transcriptional regulator [Chloroflexia bacterium]|nr:MarR family transcriptional regulator [Chloroflexia bacterium]